jgi:hypothetical protein
LASWASCEVYKDSSRARVEAGVRGRLRQPRPFLRQPFQHRRDDVDVDGVLGLHIFVAIGGLVVDGLFVMSVGDRELRR